ncbi:MAG: ATP-binding protein [Candidatus Colwellbacteria bacterium]|nr:ATP-binding protein [Candidatus Colwellbacteria bacterium]
MKLTIRYKIAAFALGSVTVSIAAMIIAGSSFFKTSYTETVEKEASAIGKTVVNSIESSLSLGFKLDEIPGVNERLGYVESSYKEISGLYVTDLSDKILFSSDPMRTGAVIRYSSGEKGRVLPDESTSREITDKGEIVHEISVPIDNNGIVGYLKVTVPDRVISTALIPLITIFAIISIIIFIGSMIIAFFVSARISKPIKKLGETARLMATGDFSIRATQETDDEVGDLAGNFNYMASEIEKNQEKLQKNITELQELLELKTEFMHIINHQLRTPLSVMRGYLEFWRTGQYQKFTPEKQEDIKHKIITATDQLASIIHSMIDALEVEGGRLIVHDTTFNVGDLIKEIYDVDFASKYDNKGLSLKADLDAAPTITSDVKYVTAIISNLFDNAMKYTPSGEISVTAKSEGEYAIIKMSDTGIGLSEDDMQHLFQKFTRGAMAPKVSPTGSGIGLYIVKQMTDAISGTVQAESKGRNQGTTFTIRIPINK